MGSTRVQARAEKARRRPVATYYTGTVVQVVDDRHCRVSFADKEVPAVVPASLLVELNDLVRLRVKGNDYSVDSVIAGEHQSQWVKDEVDAAIRWRGDWDNESGNRRGDLVRTYTGEFWVALGDTYSSPPSQRDLPDMGVVTDAAAWPAVLGACPVDGRRRVLAASGSGAVWSAAVGFGGGFSLAVEFPTVDGTDIWLGAVRGTETVGTIGSLEAMAAAGFSGVRVTPATGAVSVWWEGTERDSGTALEVVSGLWEVRVSERGPVSDAFPAGPADVSLLLRGTVVWSSVVDADGDYFWRPAIGAAGDDVTIKGAPQLEWVSDWVQVGGFELADLKDVLTAGLEDGQILAWREDLGKWAPRFLPGEAPPPEARSVRSGFSASATTITFTAPTDTKAGDLLVAYLGCQSVATPPTGWRRLAHPLTAVSSSHGGHLFARTAAAGDAGASWTVAVASQGTPPWHVVAVTNPGPILSAGAERIGVAANQVIYPATLGGGEGLMVLFGSARSATPVTLTMLPALADPSFAVQSTDGVQSRVAVGPIAGATASCLEVTTSAVSTGVAVAGVLIGGQV